MRSFISLAPDRDISASCLYTQRRMRYRRMCRYESNASTIIHHQIRGRCTISGLRPPRAPHPWPPALTPRREAGALALYAMLRLMIAELIGFACRSWPMGWLCAAGVIEAWLRFVFTEATSRRDAREDAKSRCCYALGDWPGSSNAARRPRIAAKKTLARRENTGALDERAPRSDALICA